MGIHFIRWLNKLDSHNFCLIFLYLILLWRSNYFIFAILQIIVEIFKAQSNTNFFTHLSERGTKLLGQLFLKFSNFWKINGTWMNDKTQYIYSTIYFIEEQFFYNCWVILFHRFLKFLVTQISRIQSWKNLKYQSFSTSAMICRRFHVYKKEGAIPNQLCRGIFSIKICTSDAFCLILLI